MKRFVPTILAISLISIVAFTYLLHSKNASAAINHLVISEIQINGAGVGTPSNDFVEIYNPTELDISLEGLRLGKKTSGTSSANVVIFTEEDSVPAHGYFLWCNTILNASLACDSSGSGTLANNNSLGLIDGSLTSGIVIDAVTFGIPTTTFGEGTNLTAPAGGTSVERKANSSSTISSMGIGGIDEFMGNGWDTNDNSSDFVTRVIPQAQNSLSDIEPIDLSPVPTIKPSVTPEPTEVPSPTPSVEPTAIPTEQPSPTPSQTPSVTPTIEPSPTVTILPTTPPSPTLTPVPTSEPTPTVIPSPTPTRGPIIVTKNPIMTCSLTFKPIRIFKYIYFFPKISCVKT